MYDAACRKNPAGMSDISVRVLTSGEHWRHLRLRVPTSNIDGHCGFAIASCHILREWREVEHGQPDVAVDVV